jgi:DNA excision repair protein ERCC-1
MCLAFSAYLNSNADLMKHLHELFQVIDALTSIRSVNKTDAMTLLNIFGSVAGIVKATPDKIALCPGFGPHKAQKAYAALHETFKRAPN